MAVQGQLQKFHFLYEYKSLSAKIFVKVETVSQISMEAKIAAHLKQQGIKLIGFGATNSQINFCCRYPLTTLPPGSSVDLTQLSRGYASF